MPPVAVARMRTMFAAMSTSYTSFARSVRHNKPQCSSMRSLSYSSKSRLCFFKRLSAHWRRGGEGFDFTISMARCISSLAWGLPFFANVLMKSVILVFCLSSKMLFSSIFCTFRTLRAQLMDPTSPSVGSCFFFCDGGPLILSKYVSNAVVESPLAASNKDIASSKLTEHIWATCCADMMA